MRPVDRVGEASLEGALDLLEDRFRPIAVLLFGSRSREAHRATSDVDLGLLLGRVPVDPILVATTKADLEALLGKDVDLVVLDDASPILAMEVLRNHRVLRSRDDEALERFVVRTLGAYFDLKRVRAPIERALLSRRPA